MEFDSITSEQNVMGVEFCTGYADKDGLTVKGFYCHQGQLIFCCGNAQTKYCCSKSEKLAQHQLYQLESSQTSVLNTRAVSMITLISASILTFIITIILTSLAMTACQRLFAKKFRSNCTAGICLESSCNMNVNGDMCGALSGSLAPTSPLNATALLINNSNLNDVNMTNRTNLNSTSNMSSVGNTNGPILTNVTNEQYAGPISNCSSTSTDQCTIDTNSTLLTNLSDSTNNSQSNYNPTYNFNSPTLNLATYASTMSTSISATLTNTMSQQTSISSGLNRITSALASITNLLTNNSQRNQLQLTTSDNSVFHISGNDQLNELIISQPPPPAYTDSGQYSEPIGNATYFYEEIRQQPQEYSIHRASPYYNELCT